MYINRPCRFILILSKAVAYLACNVYRRERAEMGVNLVVPHRTLGSPGTPGVVCAPCGETKSCETGGGFGSACVVVGICCRH